MDSIIQSLLCTAVLGLRGGGHLRAALRRFRRVPDKYDVALIDLGMRPMDGLQLARHLRDVRGDLPIIIVSGRSLEGRQLPPDTVCLEKPYRIESLNDALDQTLVRT